MYGTECTRGQTQIKSVWRKHLEWCLCEAHTGYKSRLSEVTSSTLQLCRKKSSQFLDWFTIKSTLKNGIQHLKTQGQTDKQLVHKSTNCILHFIIILVSTIQSKTHWNYLLQYNSKSLGQRFYPSTLLPYAWQQSEKVLSISETPP